MRESPYNPKSELMRYGIREVVDLAQRVASLDPELKFTGENIGDPIAKGWSVPEFVRKILVDLVQSNDPNVFGYTHSRGRIETRQWVVEYSRRFAPRSQLDYEHVMFSNGVGAGISAFYRMLAPHTRIIQPNPGYPSHISTERFSAGTEGIGYRLDPENGWQPDLEHMEQQIKRHPGVVGILINNPNNPTGAVYPAETLEAIVKLAEKYQLMLVSDEVYFRLVFNGVKYAQLTDLAAGRVPLIVMRGVSKDVPWTGSRCGWLEFHNTDLDKDYNQFFESMKRPLMIEVCSTSLPQVAVPLIYDHPDYEVWLSKYVTELETISTEIYERLHVTAGIRVRRIQGAFYMPVMFDSGVLNDRQTLPISNPDVAKFIQSKVSSGQVPLDKRFAYYLLASTGICVVPLSDFECSCPGFRVTTLDRNVERRRQTYQRIADAIHRYLASA